MVPPRPPPSPLAPGTTHAMEAQVGHEPHLPSWQPLKQEVLSFPRVKVRLLQQVREIAQLASHPKIPCLTFVHFALEEVCPTAPVMA